MENFDQHFRFFKDVVESMPGENDVVVQAAPQTFSRNELQAKLNTKIEEAKNKKKQK